jgi:hypothetical protein
VPTNIKENWPVDWDSETLTKIETGLSREAPSKLKEVKERTLNAVRGDHDPILRNS